MEVVFSWGKRWILRGGGWVGDGFLSDYVGAGVGVIHSLFAEGSIEMKFGPLLSLFVGSFSFSICFSLSFFIIFAF